MRGTALDQVQLCDFGQGSRCATTGADGPDSAQSSEAQQSQFIDEIIDIPVSAQRQNTSKSNAFRRPYRIQKIMEIPQLQYTVKMVDVPAESSKDNADAAGPVHREAVHAAAMHDNPLYRDSAHHPGDAED